MDAEEALAGLRAVWVNAPVTRERWHAWVDEIASTWADVDLALDVLENDEAARAALPRLLEEGVSGTSAAGELGAALRRLAVLPRPDGKHPYVEEILPALEAAEVALAAVASDPAASSRFAALAQRAPASVPAGS